MEISVSMWLITGAVWISPLAFIWWFLRYRKEGVTARYPEWIYGMDQTFRYRLVRLGLVVACFAVLTISIAVREAQWPVPPVFSVLGSVGLLVLFGFLSLKMARCRRSYELTYEQGVETVADIVDRSESNLRGPSLDPTIVGSEVVALQGAALIARGAWKMKIRFEVESRTFESERRVSSQAYYRFRRSGKIPIRVRPEAPDAWIPNVESRG